MGRRVRIGVVVSVEFWMLSLRLGFSLRWYGRWDWYGYGGTSDIPCAVGGIHPFSTNTQPTSTQEPNRGYEFDTHVPSDTRSHLVGKKHSLWCTSYVT